MSSGGHETQGGQNTSTDTECALGYRCPRSFIQKHFFSFFPLFPWPKTDRAQGWGAQGRFCGLPQAAAAVRFQSNHFQIPKSGPRGPTDLSGHCVFSSIWCPKPYMSLSPVVLWLPTLQRWETQGQAAQPRPCPPNCGR